VFAIFGQLFSGSSAGEAFTLGGIFTVLSVLWTIIVVLAYIISIVFLTLYVYASVRKNLISDLQTQALRNEEKLYDQLYRGVVKSNRLEDVLAHSGSSNPNDWKLAIIEADIILDDILKQQGYAGNSLGERLKSIAPSQLESLQDAWEAHKVRNNIAHQGADFILTQRLAQETITKYQRVFTEFGVT
jgi:c-di-AMP phosphodiesterase-like protein